MARKPVLEIDGRSFDTLEGFYDEVTRSLGLSAWGRNIDAFNDILRGGFGTPKGGFVLRWINSDRSRAALSYEATARYREENLTRCHPSNLDYVLAQLTAARRREGQTLFDVLVEIIRLHGEGGEEHADGVELELA